jgi:hypothetical protein
MSLFTVHDHNSTFTGVGTVALNATTNMNPIPVSGADLVTLYITCVNATGAALPIVGTMQCRKAGTTNWHTMQTRAIVAGVETLSNRSISKTTPAAASTYRYEVSFEDINADEWRLSSLTAAGAGATDLLTITAHVRLPIKG